MKVWPYVGTGLLALLGVTPVAAQVPGVPAGAAAPAVATPAAAAGVAATPRGFEFIRKCQEQKELCKRKLCESTLGQLLNNSMKPMTAFTGGLIPPCCPTTPSVEELQELQDDPGPLGAAAAIKMDEANAKKRRAAVRYLSTADCNWWPEAEKGLIVALRTDRNECVRLEAASGLGNGCCCTRRVIEALAITVEGSKKDGNPPENSERVRNAALVSLHHCLSCYHDIQLVDPNAGRPKEGPVTANPSKRDEVDETKSKIKLPAHYVEVEKKPFADVVANARRVAKAAESEKEVNVLPTGERTLFNVFYHSTPPGTAVSWPDATPASAAEPAVAATSAPPLAIDSPIRPVAAVMPAVTAPTPRTSAVLAPVVSTPSTPPVIVEAAPRPVSTSTPLFGTPAPRMSRRVGRIVEAPVSWPAQTAPQVMPTVLPSQPMPVNVPQTRGPSAEPETLQFVKEAATPAKQ
ncbi:MAG: hypothetical protein JNM56_40890 [Planctomycetia bacterium]|nr:hypothetical protein [Planctomycetia bacterium]